ncbi:MAG TPA: helix-turn-helix domain-containing protein [Candidatus Oscillibacter excrementigallinarum]|uniref:Helix-turn-helix domain-containing protein n=1 Tax=Candidatus Oscillibacter excrementigallinarum TaxID=2838716 RepID=A0A9D2LJ88_9FIRM|nr:helix-turn-helix domain-containing protein [Candidatus Oscillibacter excrementigallinarum]
MLAENLKALRKAKGLSQEELAARLHVVRQTVSKWEKGRSVPDADLLVRLAEELDTTPAALLGPEVPPEAEGGGTAEQLGRIAEQLAIKNRRARRIWKIVAGVLIAFVAVNLLLVLLNAAAFRSFTTEAEVAVEGQAVPAEETFQSP